MNGIVGAFRAIFLNQRTAEEIAGAEAAALAEAKSHCTVLVIDDDSGVLEVLRPLLKEAGYTVLTAQSGAKGLDLLRYAQKDVRVVVLDYNMPRLSGSDTLTYLRKLAPHTKVIALSGVEAELLPEEYRSSVDRLMHKPFRGVELIRAINDLAGIALPKVAA